MDTLRTRLIRLAHQNPELREHLLPLLASEKAAWAQEPQEQKLGEWVLKWTPRNYKSILVESPDWSDEAVLQGTNVVYDEPSHVPSNVQDAVKKMFRKVQRA